MKKNIIKKGEKLADKIKEITIKTARYPNNREYSILFPKELNYRSHISEIEFSHPVIDFKEKENKKLTLITTWFNSAFSSDPYWKQWLNNEEGFHLLSRKSFEELKGHFMDYSEYRLKKWQEQALEKHKKCLESIDKLYFQSEKPEISKNFFY